MEQINQTEKFLIEAEQADQAEQPSVEIDRKKYIAFVHAALVEAEVFFQIVENLIQQTLADVEPLTDGEAIKNLVKTRLENINSSLKLMNQNFEKLKPLPTP